MRNRHVVTFEIKLPGWILCTVILLLALSSAFADEKSPARSFPGADWTRLKPEEAGFSTSRLEALRTWLATQSTTALVICVNGKLIFEYGDIQRVSKIASVRKSILGLLYGHYVFSGKIDLNQTVKRLGLQEKEPFQPIEERATLEHLLAARSGIYLPSGNQELDDQTPRRGSQPPGSTFSYNNWDFNAAGTAFEKLTGKSIYDALDTDLARPIGMQDFDRARQKSIPAPPSMHPEYAMNLSTRDMARVGLLTLRYGQWNTQQIVPADWCRYLTHLVTPFDQLNPVALKVAGRFGRWGYGSMWWVWEALLFPGGVSMGPLQGAYTALGAGGQFITVLPVLDMVIAHKVDIDRNPTALVSPIECDAILAMIIASTAPSTKDPSEPQPR